MSQHRTPIRFLHLRHETGALCKKTGKPILDNHRGRTIAYQLFADGAGTLLKFAIAGCHPKDNFSKKFGRDESMNRLLNGHFKTVPIGADEKVIDRLLAENKEVPSLHRDTVFNPKAIPLVEVHVDEGC